MVPWEHIRTDKDSFDLVFGVRDTVAEDKQAVTGWGAEGGGVSARAMRWGRGHSLHAGGQKATSEVRAKRTRWRQSGQVLGEWAWGRPLRTLRPRQNQICWMSMYSCTLYIFAIYVKKVRFLYPYPPKKNHFCPLGGHIAPGKNACCRFPAMGSHYHPVLGLIFKSLSRRKKTDKYPQFPPPSTLDQPCNSMAGVSATMGLYVCHLQKRNDFLSPKWLCYTNSDPWISGPPWSLFNVI